MDLGERKNPSSAPTSEGLLFNVEDSCELSTPPGEKRVSARRGWAGEKSDFFSILFEEPCMIRIRPATEADFSALLQVQQDAFGEYAAVYKVSGWTTETLDSLKEDAKEKHIFVAETEGVVIGSVRFWNVAGVCVMRLLSVSPTHQSRGVAKLLIREVERVATDAHKFFACTMLNTARNIHLFMSLGYKAESILPDHYDHLDLICFAKYKKLRAEG